MQSQQTFQNHHPAPLISFIVACYNIPTPMLCQCLESIMALSLNSSEREVIVIDDGSEQSPLPELSKYADDIIYVRQRNAGLSQARNRGLQIASGQYVQFVDADDYLLRSPYEHCLDLVRYQHPDVVMFDFTDGDTNDDATFNTGDLKSGTEYLSQHNLQATACCYIFRRQILGELRFTPGIYHEDEEFTPLLMLRAETLCTTNAKAYFYRQRKDSIVSNNDIRHCMKRLRDLKGVISRLNYIADHRPIDDRTALQRRIAQLTMDYLYQIIIQTQSYHYLERKITELRKEGLFPLPEQDYTRKYTWFRRLTATTVGRRALIRVIPLMNKER